MRPEHTLGWAGRTHRCGFVSFLFHLRVLCSPRSHLLRTNKPGILAVSALYHTGHPRVHRSCYVELFPQDKSQEQEPKGGSESIQRGFEGSVRTGTGSRPADHQCPRDTALLPGRLLGDEQPVTTQQTPRAAWTLPCPSGLCGTPQVLCSCWQVRLLF